MRKRGLMGYFKDIFGAPMAKKDIFSRVLKAENARPAEVLFIGDSREDYQSATEAGLCFVARISDGQFRDLAAAKFNDMNACKAYIQSNF
jgi:FMN phosphatase YigB (HAD superfamily)